MLKSNICWEIPIPTKEDFLKDQYHQYEKTDSKMIQNYRWGNEVRMPVGGGDFKLRAQG